MHAVKDDNYQAAIHDLHECGKLAENVCRYDLDHLDSVWLQTFNQERRAMGQCAEFVLQLLMGLLLGCVVV